MLMALDEGVGRVLNELESLGLRQKTLVMFSNDNGVGGVLADPHRGRLNGRKSSVYEGGVKVPIIISMPGTIEQNKVIDTMISAMDLIPTAADYCGVKFENQQDLDGRSLKGLLSGEQKEVHDYLYWRYSPQKAIRKGGFKLVQEEDGPEWQLYNLLVDPAESKNLAAEHPELVQELQKAYEKWNQNLIKAKWKFKTRGEDNFSPDKAPHISPLLAKERAEGKVKTSEGDE
jgi:arylsulfatase A-like enzyme